jgi:hypothetical protein
MQPPAPAEVSAAAARATRRIVPPVGRPFDVVLSPCLLSQLCGYASDVLGRNHPRRRELLLALRTRHLRTIVDLLAPGGVGVVVCDVASSTGYPDLVGIKKERLPGLLDRLTYTDRGFDRLSPAAMRQALRDDPLIAPLLGPVQQVPPWLWHLGPARVFLVYALRLRRLRGPVLFPGGSSVEPPRLRGAPCRGKDSGPQAGRLNEKESRDLSATARSPPPARATCARAW